MRDIRHENLNTFVGACVEQGHVCVLSKLCPKGSLDDILQNDDIQLDLMFKISFMMDICSVSNSLPTRQIYLVKVTFLSSLPQESEDN